MLTLIKGQKYLYFLHLTINKLPFDVEQCLISDTSIFWNNKH